MIDILYIIGKESRNYDLEILCSLRTVQKYVKDRGLIYITGRCPAIINEQKVIFTPAEDIGCPMINHWWKVQKTIQQTNIGSDFILMYDDIFFTKPTELTEYPNYQKGKLGDETDVGGQYMKSIQQTKKWLKKNRRSQYDFELHVPFRYNTEKFLLLEDIFTKMETDKYGMAVRSIYGNMFEYNPPYKHDVKIREPEDLGNPQIMGQECISTSDYTFPFVAAPILEKHIQKRSIWENDNHALHR